MDGLLSIKFFIILSSFCIRLTNPSRLSDNSCYDRLLQGFRLCLAPRHKLISAGLPPCFVRRTQSLLFDRGDCVVFQNHISRSFRVCRGVSQEQNVGFVFYLFSSMVSLLLCFLPLAALFMLTIWPFGSLPPSFLLL